MRHLLSFTNTDRPCAMPALPAGVQLGKDVFPRFLTLKVIPAQHHKGFSWLVERDPERDFSTFTLTLCAPCNSLKMPGSDRTRNNTVTNGAPFLSYCMLRIQSPGRSETQTARSPRTNSIQSLVSLWPGIKLTSSGPNRPAAAIGGGILYVAS